MKIVEVDINYTSVEDAIKALQEFVGLNASIALTMESVPYDRERIAVNIEIPENAKTTTTPVFIGNDLSKCPLCHVYVGTGAFKRLDGNERKCYDCGGSFIWKVKT